MGTLALGCSACCVAAHSRRGAIRANALGEPVKANTWDVKKGIRGCTSSGIRKRSVSSILSAPCRKIADGDARKAVER